MTRGLMVYLKDSGYFGAPEEVRALPAPQDIQTDDTRPEVYTGPQHLLRALKTEKAKKTE